MCRTLDVFRKGVGLAWRRYFKIESQTSVRGLVVGETKSGRGCGRLAGKHKPGVVVCECDCVVDDVALVVKVNRTRDVARSLLIDDHQIGVRVCRFLLGRGVVGVILPYKNLLLEIKVKGKASGCFAGFARAFADPLTQ